MQEGLLASPQHPLSLSLCPVLVVAMTDTQSSRSRGKKAVHQTRKGLQGGAMSVVLPVHKLEPCALSGCSILHILSEWEGLFSGKRRWGAVRNGIRELRLWLASYHLWNLR